MIGTKKRDPRPKLIKCLCGQWFSTGQRRDKTICIHCGRDGRKT